MLNPFLRDTLGAVPRPAAVAQVAAPATPVPASARAKPATVVESVSGASASGGIAGQQPDTGSATDTSSSAKEKSDQPTSGDATTSKPRRSTSWLWRSLRVLGWGVEAEVDGATDRPMAIAAARAAKDAASKEKEKEREKEAAKEGKQAAPAAAATTAAAPAATVSAPPVTAPVQAASPALSGASVAAPQPTVPHVAKGAVATPLGGAGISEVVAPDVGASAKPGLTNPAAPVFPVASQTTQSQESNSVATAPAAAAASAASSGVTATASPSTAASAPVSSSTSTSTSTSTPSQAQPPLAAASQPAQLLDTVHAEQTPPRLYLLESWEIDRIIEVVGGHLKNIDSVVG